MSKLTPDIIEHCASVMAEAFYVPENDIELRNWKRLRFWQLGPREQARWRKVAEASLKVLLANDIEVNVGESRHEATATDGLFGIPQ